jgi:hypothetical protein
MRADETGAAGDEDDGPIFFSWMFQVFRTESLEKAIQRFND